jgi:hypothetical protein
VFTSLVTFFEGDSLIFTMPFHSVGFFSLNLIQQPTTTFLSLRGSVWEFPKIYRASTIEVSNQQQRTPHRETA